MKERPEEIQLILDNLGKQLTELRESVGVKRSYIYRNGTLPAGSVISIESATRNSYVKSLFEYLKMVGGYILLKSRDENVDGVEIESIKDISAAFINILHDKKVTHNWLHDKTGIELRVISRAITGSKESNVGMLFLCASVLGFDFFVCKKDRFVLPKKAKKLMINKVLPEYDTKLMTRAEFGILMIKAKKESGIGTSELCFTIKMLPQSLRRMEKGDNNFLIDNMFLYINAIHYYVFFKNTRLKQEFKISNREDFITYLKQIRRSSNATQLEVAKKIDMTIPVIAGIESGKRNVFIDVFFKLAQIFGYTIELKKIE